MNCACYIRLRASKYLARITENLINRSVARGGKRSIPIASSKVQGERIGRENPTLYINLT